LAFTHARSRTCHWSIASSMISWDRLDQQSMRRCLSSLTSPKGVLYTHALAFSPRFCIMCACPQIMCAKYYELRCMFKKNWILSKLAHLLDAVSKFTFFSVCSLREDNVITSKPTWKPKLTNSILEYSEYFCQISSKSLLVILSYTVLKLRRLFWDTV